MGVRLTVKRRAEAGGAEKPQVVTLSEDTITLGRDDQCDVVLAQPAVSRSHARISRDGTLFFVEDLGSSFGTLLNGSKLKKNEKQLLRNGDTIAIAQFDVVFDRIADVTESNAGNTMFVSRNLVKDVMKGLGTSGEQPYFRVMNGPREGHRIEVADAQEYVFGRDDTADIVLNDDLVSRRHARVRRDWSGTHVEDLGSRNGIKVNKQRTKKATLKDRDEVEIGGVKLLYLDPSEVRETPVLLPSESQESEEGTVSVAEEQQQDEPAAEEPPAEEPAAEDPPPEEPAAEEPPAEEPAAEAQGEESPVDEPLLDDPSNTTEDPPEGRAKLIDFSNKQTVIALGAVGLFVLVAVLLVVLVFVA
ncbi:MAG: FHA domain-containing protein [Myxococcaceae bacterium]|jgi:pSer/pThr/pTyr-binding forkhead associated (FHA) protein|nr:FHA domain-containing protein [Myxococcaceae bacterium]